MDLPPHTHFCVTVIDGLYFFIITWTLVVFILKKMSCFNLCFFLGGGSELADSVAKTWAGVGGFSLLCCKDLVFTAFSIKSPGSQFEIWKHMYKNHFYVLFLINHCV